MAIRPPLDDSTALVTGASAGIGRALARLLARRSRRLVLVARRRDRLDALATELRATRPNLEVTIVSADLTDREALLGAMDRIEAEVGAIDVLVNNAGFGTFGRFAGSEWAKVDEMIALNVRALVLLTHRVLPGMIAKGRGGILNVSSGFGMFFAPGFSTYVGTKHFVTGFTESLRLEVSSHGIAVSQLCPGPVRTEFQTVAGMDALGAVDRVSMPVDACAAYALRRFERGDAMIVPGPSVRALYALGGLVPRAVLRSIMRPFARRLPKLERGS